MTKEVDPSDIGKHPDLIKRAQQDMAECDVLVCGRCHGVFHFMELFSEHKSRPCRNETSLKNNRETKPKVWAFLLWKSSQLHGDESDNVNSWKLYQSWVKLDEAVRETWVVAGHTIQSFAKMGQGNLQEMPVKITKTVVDTTIKNTVEPKKLKPGVKESAVNRSQSSNDTSPKTTAKKSLDSAAAGSIAKITDATETKRKTASPAGTSSANNKQSNAARSPLAKLQGNPVKSVGASNKMATRTVPNADGKNEEHNVEKILAKRFNPRHRHHEYLVKWEKLSTEKNTWEPLAHFDTCKKLLDSFEVQLARQKEQRAALNAKAEADAAALVEKEKEKRKLGIAEITASELPSPERLARTSKLKALNQVKKWCAEGDGNGTQATKKRKTDDSEFEVDGEDEQSAEDDTFDQPPVKIIKRDSASSVIKQAIINAGLSGAISNTTTSKVPANTAAIVQSKVNGALQLFTDAATSNDGTNKTTGIVQKIVTSPPKPTTTQVTYVSKTENGVSGIVRNETTTTATAAAKIPPRPLSTAKQLSVTSTARPSGITLKTVTANPSSTSALTNKSAVITKKTIVGSQKASGVSVQQVSRAATSTNLMGNTIISRVAKVPASTSGSRPTSTMHENKLAALQRQGGLKIVKKTSAPQEQANTVPTPLSSPPAELTLCPVTGKVLGQIEEPEDQIKPVTPTTLTIGNDLQSMMTDATSTPMLVTGEDGTVYQVAGKNEQGQTILIAQGSDGTQQCVYMAAEDGAADLHAEAAENMLQLDPSTTDSYHSEQMMITDENHDISGQPQMRIINEHQNTIDTNQPLTISTGDTESQDGQVTAEVVQADLPSPGGTRRVVLLLPDGTFMMTEVSDEQYQSLNLAT